MAGQGYSNIAASAALAILIMAVSACASSEQPLAAAVAFDPGAAEFHDADIGDDTLRSRLPSD